MEMRNPAIAAHAREVSELVVRVGTFLGLGREALAEAELAASFHDIGKAAVPDRVLLKPGPLDRSEWQVMARHAEWGAELLRHLPDCSTIAPFVRHHHERWDGGGYPDGLVGDEIPRPSRIIGVCDAYAAMVVDRPYRAALGPAVACETLLREAGSQFDPSVVTALFGAMTAGPPQ
jgi:HD-GYP domain-containing protein (c-di-GMP phosphodiesterase class II)